jgi:hypothetical protein
MEYPEFMNNSIFKTLLSERANNDPQEIENFKLASLFNYLDNNPGCYENERLYFNSEINVIDNKWIKEKRCILNMAGKYSRQFIFYDFITIDLKDMENFILPIDEALIYKFKFG